MRVQQDRSSRPFPQDTVIVSQKCKKNDATAYFNPLTLGGFGIARGDFITLTGEGRSTVVTALEDKRLEQGEISISPTIRNNLRVRAGDRVHVKEQQSCNLLDKVIIGVLADTLGSLSPDDMQPIIDGYFNNDYRPVTEGDVYDLRGPAGNVQIEVVRTFMGSWGMVTSDTVKEVLREPLKREDGRQEAAPGEVQQMRQSIQMTSINANGQQRGAKMRPVTVHDRPSSKRMNQIFDFKLQNPANHIIDALSLSCPACMEGFDEIEKVPMIICSNQHRYCLQCMDYLFNTSSSGSIRCPECRQDIKKSDLKKDRFTIELLNAIESVRNQNNKARAQLQKARREIKKLVKEKEELQTELMEQDECGYQVKEMDQKLPPFKLNKYVDKSVTFDFVGGLEAQRKILREFIEMRLSNEDRFARYGIRPESVALLYGPEGSGKSFCVRALCSTMKLNIVTYEGEALLELTSMLCQQFAIRLFSKAKAQAPCVVFFNKVEMIGTSNPNIRKGEIWSVLLKFFRKEIASRRTNHQLWIVATTDSSGFLESSSFKREHYDRLVEFSRPNYSARLAILNLRLRQFEIGADVSLEDLAKETEYYSGADLWRMCEMSIKEALRQKIKETGLKRQDLRENCPALTKKYFANSLKEMCASIKRGVDRPFTRVIQVQAEPDEEDEALSSFEFIN